MASPFKKQVALLLANSPAFQKRGELAIPGLRCINHPSRSGDACKNKGIENDQQFGARSLRGGGRFCVRCAVILGAL